MTDIRPEQPSDREAVRRVVEAAFTGHGPEVADMVDALNDAGRTQVSLVAEVEGSVVGHVQLSRSWIDAREKLVDALVLSPLGVAPELQRDRLRATLCADPRCRVPGGRLPGSRVVDDGPVRLLRPVLGAGLRGPSRSPLGRAGGEVLLIGSNNCSSIAYDG